MAFSSCLCTSSTKKMLVKIVHPGGHYELHDRPVLAAEIMRRNPRCCAAHPHVFQEPWAIVSPEAKLMPGQKYHVVPISTIRKLQRPTLKYSPSSVQQIRSIQSSKVEEENNGTASTCNWFFMNKSNTTKLTYASMKPDDVQIVSRIRSSRMKSSSYILILRIDKKGLRCTGVAPATEPPMLKLEWVA